jgi:hypothetical protein
MGPRDMTTGSRRQSRCLPIGPSVARVLSFLLCLAPRRMHLRSIKGNGLGGEPSGAFPHGPCVDAAWAGAFNASIRWHVVWGRRTVMRAPFCISEARSRGGSLARAGPGPSRTQTGGLAPAIRSPWCRRCRRGKGHCDNTFQRVALLAAAWADIRFAARYPRVVERTPSIVSLGRPGPLSATTISPRSRALMSANWRGCEGGFAGGQWRAATVRASFIADA